MTKTDILLECQRCHDTEQIGCLDEGPNCRHEWRRSVLDVNDWLKVHAQCLPLAARGTLDVRLKQIVSVADYGEAFNFIPGVGPLPDGWERDRDPGDEAA